MEEDRYSQEISSHIEREAKLKRGEDGINAADDSDLVNEFKELVAT